MTSYVCCRLVAAVIVDSMSIRKRIDWDGHNVYGYVNVGSEISGDNIPEATQALVFHLVFLNNCWKFPLGSIVCTFHLIT